jgi:hypothetical protein
MKLRALFATGTLTLALTVALAVPAAAQYQEPQQQPQVGAERQAEPQPQTGTQRQEVPADPDTTGTTGQFGAEQQDLPATASPLPLIALAGLASLAGAWTARRFRL